MRRYQFSIGTDRLGHLTLLTDDLPWLGLYVTATDTNVPPPPTSPVQVVAIAPGSPASSMFHVGDLILAVKGPRAIKNANDLLGPAIIDQVDAQRPGDAVRFDVERGSQTTTLAVPLGSLLDPSARRAFPPRSSDVLLI